MVPGPLVGWHRSRSREARWQAAKAGGFRQFLRQLGRHSPEQGGTTGGARAAKSPQVRGKLTGAIGVGRAPTGLVARCATRTAYSHFRSLYHDSFHDSLGGKWRETAAGRGAAGEVFPVRRRVAGSAGTGREQDPSSSDQGVVGSNPAEGANSIRATAEFAGREESRSGVTCAACERCRCVSGVQHVRRRRLPRCPSPTLPRWRPGKRVTTDRVLSYGAASTRRDFVPRAPASVR
jgi:hypothetical protein